MHLFREPSPELTARLTKGEIGVLPTDTLYGLSGDARDPSVVARINELKGRSVPASVVPHQLAWAREQVREDKRERFDVEMPARRGQTLLFPCSDTELPAPLVSSGLVAFRWPAHLVSELAAQAGVPLVTTSVNKTGAPPIHALAQLDDDMRTGIDFALDAGPLTGPASSMVFFDVEPPRVVERR